MSSSLAFALNVLLAIAIVASILAVLAWGILAHRRDERRGYHERRRGRDRRRLHMSVGPDAERRRSDRRAARALQSA